MQYGRLDGELSCRYAVAFSSVYRTLTPQQRQVLARLRNLDGYRAAPAYIYSDPVDAAPRLPDTDRFFFPSRGREITTDVGRRIWRAVLDVEPGKAPESALVRTSPSSSRSLPTNADRSILGWATVATPWLGLFSERLARNR